MSKKTFAIISGIVGAVIICANTIILLFDILAKLQFAMLFKQADILLLRFVLVS